MSVEEGKELSEELKRDISNKSAEKKEDVINKFDEMRPLTKEILKDILDEKNYVTKADLLELKRRFDIIEEKLDIIINKSNEAKTEE